MGERLLAYALRIDGVHIVDGKSEVHAVERAVDSGLLPSSRAIWDKDEEGNYRVEWGGFRTSEGRFVKGAEAMQVAKRAGQLRRSSWHYRVRHDAVIPFIAGSYLKRSFSDVEVKDLDTRHLSEIESAIRGKIEGGERLDRWQIESRAIRYGTPDGEVGTNRVDRFSWSGRWLDTAEDGTERPSLVIEGYLLDTGDFISRQEARTLFTETDISWETADTGGNDPHDLRPGA